LLLLFLRSKEDEEDKDLDSKLFELARMRKALLLLLRLLLAAAAAVLAVVGVVFFFASHVPFSAIFMEQSSLLLSPC
jgi:hypothetical protein